MDALKQAVLGDIYPIVMAKPILYLKHLDDGLHQGCFIDYSKG